jgi:predicted HD superfamily hydrolase involved in NAD metabolism
MDYTNLSVESILDWLKNNLSEKRYQHSLGTAECARNLAITYGLNEEKAYVAGLLHDCAKCFPNEKLLSIIERHIDVDENEKMNYKTLHAPVSAYSAEKTFGVKDEEMLSSIRWHTLGKVNMTEFEKIIFIADKIEERTRENWYAQPIRALLRESNGLDKSILQCYRQTIKSLVDRDLKICPLTIDIYNHYEDMVGTK